MFSVCSIDEHDDEYEELDDTFLDYPPTPAANRCDTNPFGTAEGTVTVTLPERYCREKAERADRMQLSMQEREGDLSVALQWLKQEVVSA